MKIAESPTWYGSPFIELRTSRFHGKFHWGLVLFGIQVKTPMPMVHGTRHAKVTLVSLENIIYAPVLTGLGMVHEIKQTRTIPLLSKVFGSWEILKETAGRWTDHTHQGVHYRITECFRVYGFSKLPWLYRCKTQVPLYRVEGEGLTMPSSFRSIEWDKCEPTLNQIVNKAKELEKTYRALEIVV